MDSADGEREGPVMLLSQFAIEKKVISRMLVWIFALGGMIAFFSLGQLEDPPFTIKDAKIIVAYPGASPQQVEEEVTFPVEQALHHILILARLPDWISSVSCLKRTSLRIPKGCRSRNQKVSLVVMASIILSRKLLVLSARDF